MIAIGRSTANKRHIGRCPGKCQDRLCQSCAALGIENIYAIATKPTFGGVWTWRRAQWPFNVDSAIISGLDPNLCPTRTE
jgi:hypothetical protein